MIANRDFVNLRAWKGRPDQGEWTIVNHSVLHPNYPEKKGFVRFVQLHFLFLSKVAYFFTSPEPGPFRVDTSSNVFKRRVALRAVALLSLTSVAPILEVDLFFSFSVRSF